MTNRGEDFAFDTIVVGVDGRPHDEDALALARLLGSPSARIVVATIAAGDELAAPAAPEYDIALGERARQTVDDVVARHDGIEGICVGAATLGEGIADVADRVDADLVVVASSRRARVGRVFSGAAIHDVLRHARRPVAVAAVAQAAEDHPLRQIVVGYDGSAESEAAVRLSAALSERGDSEVMVVEVIDPVVPISPVAGVYVGDSVIGEPHRARTELDGLRQEFGFHGIVAVGRVAHELAEASEQADLLVVGFHDAGVVRRLVAATTARRLLRHQTVPLLFVPRPGSPESAADEIAPADAPRVDRAEVQADLLGPRCGKPADSLR